MDIVVGIITGILASLAASFVWLFIFGKIRPNIAISPCVAKSVNSDGVATYKIKIINKSQRPIVNIKVRLVLVTPTLVPSGQVLSTKNISLKIDEILGMPKYNKKDVEAKYAFRFITFEDLDSIWNDDKKQFLMFKLYAQDSLSSLGRYFEKKYYIKRSCLKEGEFSFGNSFEII